MDQSVHCRDGRTPYDQGVHDACNGLSMQDTTNRDYQRGYDTALQSGLMHKHCINGAPAACLI